MSSDIDEFLNQVGEWKLRLHAELKDKSPRQRKAFWKRIHEEARARGLPVLEPEKPGKRPHKRIRRTG